MSIIVSRLPHHQQQQGWSYGTSLAGARHCRLDPSSSQHAAYVDAHGVLHYQHIGSAGRGATELLRFQLQYSAGDGLPFEPISKPWRFEFVPGMPGDVLLAQEGSCRILYASFPRQGSDSSDVFLFGSHTAPVRTFITNGNTVLSGCDDGVLKLWRMSDGQLADLCTTPDKSSVTAAAFLGPLLMSAGTSSSSITLFDISSGRLLAVQRVTAGPGAVDCMAAWLPPAVLAAANLAPCGPLPPDGGGVLAAARAADPSGGAAATLSAGGALLAAASSTGWLCIFAAPQPAHSSQDWSLLHSTGSLIAPGASAPAAQLAFSSDGSTLVVASPAAQLVGSAAVAAAAAGGLPGTVSLYEVAAAFQGNKAASSSALLPPLLLQQQQRGQLPDLQLWHQWSLCSMPVGLAVLPGRDFKLLAGKQLQATQVVQLYVLPEVGPGQVLCAERKLHAHKAHVPAASTAATTDTASSRPAVIAASAVQHEQQQQQASTTAAAPADGSSNSPVASTSSSSSSVGQQDEALLLNLAERDLAEVAHAIAAAAGPLRDAELEALLAGVMTADFAAAAAAVSHAETDGSTGQPAAAAPGQAGAAEPPAGHKEATGVGPPAQSGLLLPQTLPNKRSWMGAAAGTAAAGSRSTGLDLSALAQELQEEQQRFQQQKQQQLEQLQQQERQTQEEQDRQAERPTGGSSEQELPSETSFQHLLQQTGQDGTQQQQQWQGSSLEEAAAAASGLASMAAEAAEAAAATLRADTAVAATDAAGASSAVRSSMVAEAEPQPRQLPAMLRSATTASRGAAAQQAAAARNTAAAVEQTAAATTSSSSSSMVPQQAPRQSGLPPAVPAAASGAQVPAAAAVAAPRKPQQQQQQQRVQQPRDQQVSLQERLNLRRQQLLARRQPPTLGDQAGGAASGFARSLPGSDHPMAIAVQNSSRLLAAKIQEAQQTPAVTVDPTGPAALKLAATLLSDLDLAPEQQQYCYDALPDLKDVATPTCAPKLVPKQLDAHWVASRSLKPSMDTLFKPQDWQQGFVDPQVLLLHSWPTPQQVVQQLLWPGQ